MKSNHSAGEAAGGWGRGQGGGVYVAGGEKELACYVMGGDRSDEESQQRSSTECLGGEEEEASGPLQ